MHHTGKHVNVGQFLRELVGEMVDDYVANAEAMSEWCWATMMDLCGTQGTEDHPILGSSSMQQKHCMLYVPSSPAKEE